MVGVAVGRLHLLLSNTTAVNAAEYLLLLSHPHTGNRIEIENM